MKAGFLKRIQIALPLLAGLLACILGFLPLSVSASNDIGHVIFTTGSVRAVNDGETRVLRRGSKIKEGDVVRSSRFSRAQMRMKDGALIALRPGSEFGFKQYRYDEDDDSNSSSIFSLIKGGFRTISGLIGKFNKTNYQVQTTVATIGIRGTHYGLTICQEGDCNTEGNADVTDGLYGSVIDGEVSAKNEAGEVIFSNDEFFHVESLSSRAQGLIKPPGVVFAQYASDKAPEKAEEAKQIATTKVKSLHLQQANVEGALALVGEIDPSPIETSFEIAEDIDLGEVSEIVNPTVDPTPVVPEPTPIDPLATSVAPDGHVISFSYFYEDVEIVGSGVPAIQTITSDVRGGDQISLNSAQLANNALVPVSVVSTLSDGITQHEFSLAGGTIKDSASVMLPNTTINVGWGRWSEGYTSVFDGVPEATLGQLHYLVATSATTPTQLGGLTGTGNYTTLGGTRATDLLGNVAASHANVAMTVTFGTTSTIDTFTISTSVGGIDYQGEIISPVTVSTPDNIFLNLNSTTGCPNCSGQADLTFYGPNAQGAGTVYTINQGSVGAQINGAAVLIQ